MNESKLKLARARAKIKSVKEPDNLSGLVQVQKDTLDAIEGLREDIANQEPLSLTELSDAIKSLEDSYDFKDVVKEIKKEIQSLSKKLSISVEEPDLSDIVKAIKDNKTEQVNMRPFLSSIKDLAERLDKKTIKQSADDYQPVRRVIKVGNRLVFDDNPTSENRSGGGSANLQIGNEYVSVDNPVPVDIVDAEINVDLDQPSSANVTSVADTASSTTLLALNTSRKKARIYNNSSSILYVKEGTTASATDFTVALYQDDYFETTYTGRIDGIWSADSTGAALITEET